MKHIVPVLLIVIATACAQQEQRATEQTTTQQTTSAGQAQPPSAAAREQTIQVGAAFTPASVTIPANQPMRLHFRRTEEATCADEIVIPGAEHAQKRSLRTRPSRSTFRRSRRARSTSPAAWT